MRILITGASGFIGKSFLAHFLSKGHTLIAASRSSFEMDGVDHYVWELGAQFPASVISGVDAVIHLAYDFNGKTGAEKTRNETVALVKCLCNAGVPIQLFFSSYSAGKHAKSIYGITKTLIENDIYGMPCVCIVRPGLVTGEAGIYAKIKSAVQRFNIIPLPDGGRGLVPLISIERLCEETCLIVESHDIPKISNIFEVTLISLRDIVLEIAKIENKKVIIINAPSKFLIFILKVMTYIKIPLPINIDNLIGFIENQNAKHKSTLVNDKHV